MRKYFHFIINSKLIVGEKIQDYCIDFNCGLYNFRVAMYVLSLLLLTNPIFGQCSMCKATLESQTQDNGFFSGINAGILYLMIIPYLAAAIIGYAWYKTSKKNKNKKIKISKVLNRIKK